MKKCKLEDIDLFHVTNKSALTSIEKDGLKPDLSELTQECWIRNQVSSRGLDEYDDDVMESLEKEASKLPEFVFAAEGENDLLVALYQINKNALAPTPLSEILVLGITDDCAKQFKSEEIGSDIDMVSRKPVPPNCICLIDEKEWKPKYLQKQRKIV